MDDEEGDGGGRGCRKEKSARDGFAREGSFERLHLVMWVGE